MADRVRQPLKGRHPVPLAPIIPPLALGNDFTTDYGVHMAGGVMVNDGLGTVTEPINSARPSTPGTPVVSTGQATDHVFVEASWTAPTDQTVLPAQYEVYINVSGAQPVVYRVNSSITSIRIAPAKPSTTYQVKVRAISRLEVAGAFSSYGSVTSAAFVVPTVTFAPTTPSAPTVTAAVYSLLAVWTALSDVTAGYGHYDVQIATDSGFTANVRTRSIDGTIISFSDLTPGTTYYVRVRGVAPDGTAGAFSTAGSSATTKIVNGDITAATITAAAIAADTITAAQMAADSITADELAALNLAVGKYIRSTSYSAGVSGWAIDAAGNAEFNNVTVRGILAGLGVGSTNYVTNGTAETNNTTGWAASGAWSSVSNVTTSPRNGSRHIKGVYSSTPGVGYLTKSLDTLGVPGLYEAIVWVKMATVGMSLQLGVTGDVTATASLYTISTTAYTPLKVRFRTTSAGASVSLKLTSGTGTISSDVYVDDVTCYRVTEAYAGRSLPANTGVSEPGTSNGGVGAYISSFGESLRADSLGGVYAVGRDGTVWTVAEIIEDLSAGRNKLFLGDGNTEEVRLAYTSGLDTRPAVYLGNGHADLTTTAGVGWATKPTPYTPALTAASANPTLGTGSTASGFYTRLGNVVHAWGTIIFGSSPSAGTGGYRVSLPFTVDTGYYPSGRGTGLGTCNVFDSSASAQRYGAVRRGGSEFINLFLPDQTAAATGTTDLQVTSAVPWTWAASDEISWDLWYICFDPSSGDILTSDSFDRADSSSGFGNTDAASGGTVKAWTSLGSGGDFGITSNKGVKTGTTTAYRAAYVDVGDGNCYVQATISTRQTNNSTDIGICARVVDINNMYFFQLDRALAGTYAWYICRLQAGTEHYLGGGAFSSPAAADGDVIKLSVNGSTIAAYINGSLLWSGTDATFDSTNTKYGIMSYSNPTSARLDSFAVVKN
ncbi:MAG: phage tail tip fiber protein [Mycobacteriaceae bacterium]